jgi:preprotein translocase SecE subunit
VSEEEIAALVAERRAAKAEIAKNSNFVTGALEEAQLIIWPGIGDALVNTVTVIAVVFITAALLFGVNSGLASLSSWVYSSGKQKANDPPVEKLEAKPVDKLTGVATTQTVAPAPGPVSIGESSIPATL